MLLARVEQAPELGSDGADFRPEPPDIYGEQVVEAKTLPAVVDVSNRGAQPKSAGSIWTPGPIVEETTILRT